VNALIARGVLRAQALAVSLAISCFTGLELRLLVFLWHLADRWGKVQRDGVVVPLPLTHQTVAALVGASRASVPTAFGALEKDGLVSKRQDAGWILHGEPPEAARLFYDRRAAARAAAEVRDESAR
jgi:CRP/FNR family transcriptional regulator, cyclic AMP receptor protein